MLHGLGQRRSGGMLRRSSARHAEAAFKFIGSPRGGGHPSRPLGGGASSSASGLLAGLCVLWVVGRASSLCFVGRPTKHKARLPLGMREGTHAPRP